MQAVETAPSRASRQVHLVRCPLCGESFELPSALRSSGFDKPFFYYL